MKFKPNTHIQSDQNGRLATDFAKANNSSDTAMIYHSVSAASRTSLSHTGKSDTQNFTPKPKPPLTPQNITNIHEIS